MRIYSNGVYRDMTPEEVERIYNHNEEAEENDKPDPLTEMITTMSNATTLAQMRAAAKLFLEKTEG